MVLQSHTRSDNIIVIMIKRILVTIFIFLLLISVTYGKEQDKNDEKQESPLTVSGYIQTQFQYGQRDATLKVGERNTELNESFNRFGIRRGRIKVVYQQDIVTGYFQVNVTEKKVNLKDAYISVKDPWLGSISVKAGVFNTPFGYEVPYSSSKRVPPERASVLTTLFPEERDMGIKLTLQAPETSPWSILKLEAAVVAGNSIQIDLDNRKDFVGHLSVSKIFNSTFSAGGGVSYYLGGVYQGSPDVYTIENKSFVLNSNPSNKGDFAKRKYIGADARFTANTKLGKTQLLGEYLQGTQPGNKDNSNSPNYPKLPENDTYIRDFAGGYVALIQEVVKNRLSFALKYDFHNPNTKVSGNEIGLNETGAGDITRNTSGVGLAWEINSNLRLTAYYDRIQNETTDNLSGYNKDLDDNLFTLRLQYQF